MLLVHTLALQICTVVLWSAIDARMHACDLGQTECVACVCVGVPVRGPHWDRRNVHEPCLVSLQPPRCLVALVYTATTSLGIAQLKLNSASWIPVM